MAKRDEEAGAPRSGPSACSDGASGFAAARFEALDQSLPLPELHCAFAVPGLGVRSVDVLLDVRRYKRLTLEDVRRTCRGIAKVKPFIVAADWSPGALTDRADLAAWLPKEPEPQQLSLF